MKPEPSGDWRWQWSYPRGVATCPREERWYTYRGRSFMVSRYRNETGRISHFSVLPGELPYGWEGCICPTLKVALSRAAEYIDSQSQVTTTH